MVLKKPVDDSAAADHAFKPPIHMPLAEWQQLQAKVTDLAWRGATLYDTAYDTAYSRIMETRDGDVSRDYADRVARVVAKDLAVRGIAAIGAVDMAEQIRRSQQSQPSVPLGATSRGGPPA